jgi:hypothetical protein
MSCWNALCGVLDGPTVIDVEIVRHAGDHAAPPHASEEVVNGPCGDNESGGTGRPAAAIRLRLAPLPPAIASPLPAGHRKRRLCQPRISTRPDAPFSRTR